MKILCLNGSPRSKNSNSNYFLNKIDKNANIKYLYDDNLENIVDSILLSNTLIFSFPLYIDGLPCKVLELFEYIDDNFIDISNKNIYVLCNCGFWEASQNNVAVDIIKNFSITNKANYMGSFKIGAGEIIGKCNKKKLYVPVCLPFFRKIKLFKKAIIRKKKIELNTTIRPMFKRLYIFLANISWKKQLLKNNCFKSNS